MNRSRISDVVRTGGPWLVIAVSLLAIVAWPASNRYQDAAFAAPRVVAVAERDDERRGQVIAFWEGAVAEHHRNDMLSPRQLAGQYLQRYRETGDIGDVLRAQHMAERSLSIAPRNIAATAEMATVMLTLHRFRESLHFIERNLRYDPYAADFRSQQANVLMELGRYEDAARALDRIRPNQRSSVSAETARARYDELTGHLTRARRVLADALAQYETLPDAPAQAKAWYFFRSGELAFEAGDNAVAIDDEGEALALFPTDNLALKDLAKFELANHDARQALQAATKGAAVTPFPETLGYEADARAALGDARGAAATRDLIFAIERVGNAYNVNDRLLAIYYADHRLRPHDAYVIALRETSVRGDEIYAQDTLAWAAAMDGRWNVAERAAREATRYDTEDPIVQFHAGMIALHAGRRDEAERRLERALALNPHFHPVFAGEAADVLRERFGTGNRSPLYPPP